jgi:peroxiredoxin
MAKSAVLTDGSVMAAAVVSSHTDSIDEWRTFVRDHPEFRKIPILFDMGGDALRAYGATSLQSGMNHGGGHSAGHSYYVIDRSGVVRLVADDPTMGDWTSAIEEFVKSL